MYSYDLCFLLEFKSIKVVHPKEAINLLGLTGQRINFESSIKLNNQNSKKSAATLISMITSLIRK
jgi:hypothetical protein